MTTTFFRALFPTLLALLPFSAMAVPVATNDAFSVNEDESLVIPSGGVVVSASFEPSPSVLGTTWQYLDRIENENGANQSYPVDANGRPWNAPLFDSATSTIAPWATGNAPFQGGIIAGFPPGTPAILAGLAAAGNGENLISTYLFRQEFTLTATQAVESAWQLNYLIDDGALISLNGIEIYRTPTMPDGAVTTNTLSENADETNFASVSLNLSGIIQEGINRIAVEVHQTTLTSTDVGFQIELGPASDSASGGFAYLDDTFNNTSRPNNATGELDATGGFSGGALFVQVGERLTDNQSTSGGWARSFTLDNPATTTIAFRYRLNFSNGYEDDEFGEALFEVDGIRYGNDIENSLTRFRGDGIGGVGDDDSGWQFVSFDIPLTAGQHTIVLGAFSSKSTANDEVTRTWFDDLKISIPGTGGGVLRNDTGNSPEAILVVGPDYGSLNLNRDGSLTYQPMLNYNGPDSFTYLARDSEGDSNRATVELTINSVNDAPVAQPDTFPGAENETLAQGAPGLLGNDSDLENDTLNPVLVNDVSHGVLELNSDGSFTYEPQPGFFGLDSFTYRASDGDAISETVLVLLKIAPINDPPLAFDDNYTTTENIPIEINATSGIAQTVFSDTFTTPVIHSSLSGSGTLESVQGFNDRGPTGNTFSGQFLRSVASGNPSSAITLTLTDLPPHVSLSLDFLLAIIDSWDGDESFTVTVDGVEIFSETFRNTGNGQSFDYPAGSLIFRDEEAGFNGTDLYREAGYDMGSLPALRDFPHTSSTATISWFVSGDGWEGGSEESWALDNLRVSVASAPAEIVIPQGAVWAYLDDGSDQGRAWRSNSFNDALWLSGPGQLGYGDGDEATTLGFGPDDNDKYVTTYFRHSFDLLDVDEIGELVVGYLRDDSCAIYLNGTRIVLDNLDPEASATALALLNPGLTGEDTWSEVTVNPDLLVEGANSLAIEIHQNDPNSSDISMDAYLVGKRIVRAGILANDTDPEDDRLTVELLSSPQHGDLTLNPNGTFSYFPNVNYEGPDSFTYRATDGEFNSGAATVNFNITPGPNDFPETSPDTYSTNEDTPLSVTAAAGLLLNDSDPDSADLTTVIAATTTNGTLILNANGSFTYTPSLNFSGLDSFAYRVSDGTNLSRPENVTISILTINDRPLASADVYLTAPGETLAMTTADGVLKNDRDPDSPILSALLESNPASGSLSLATDGSFRYTPSNGFSGTDSFTYRANDGLLSSEPATVLIRVNAAPIAIDDRYPTIEDSPIIITAQNGILSNDQDTNILTAILVSDPAHGSLTLSLDGAFIYIPNNDFEGHDSFTYRARDSLQQSNLATVIIPITMVNDSPRTKDDCYEINTGQRLEVNAAEGILSNDTDIENASLSASLVSDVSSGLLNLSPDGSFTYEPNPDFAGTDSFFYRASDGALSSSKTEVEIEIFAASKNIVVNEIMFNPAGENDLEEYLELTNIGSSAIPLNGWRFESGVTFSFPDISLPPGEFLVVCADITTFQERYGLLPNVIGNWTGRLSNSGERILLVDQDGVEVDEVPYYDQGEWAIRERITEGNEPGWSWASAADGGGSSLELINPALSNKQGQNWAFSLNSSPTPGAANSTASANTAPLIIDVAHFPAVPTSTEAIAIIAELRDETGETIGGSLHYRISAQNPGPFQTTPMLDDGYNRDSEADDGIYGAMLPPQPNGTVIEFYLESSDGRKTRTWPPPASNGQNANALLQVDDEANTFDHAFYRVIIPVSELNQWRGIRRQSNAIMNATMILDDGSGPKIRYLAGLRVRGAGSRNHTPVPMRLSLSRDDEWNNMTRMNLNTKFTYLQFLGMKLFQTSDMRAPDTYRVQVRINGGNIARGDGFDYGSMVHVQPLAAEFIADKFKTDRDGNLYKKARPDREFQWRDGNIGDYESDGWSKQTNRSENDWNDLDEMLRVVNNAPDDPDYLNQIESVIDIDQWMKWFAAMTLLANGETNVSNGADDDFSMYRGVTDPHFVFIPHDLDTILGLGDGSRIENPRHTLFDMIVNRDILDPLIPFFTHPLIVERYYLALRELLQTSFSKQEFDELLDSNLTDWVPQNQIEGMRNFMDARRLFVESEITPTIGPPSEYPGATSEDTVASPHGDLYLSEILAINDATLEVDGLYSDTIELHNSSSVPLSLEGHTLSDNPQVPERFTFPAGTFIPANGYLIISGGAPQPAPGLYAGFNLNAEGETLSLYDSASNGGALLDSITFGLQIPDHSISRLNGAWQLSRPTLGSLNQALSLGDPNQIRINEWLSQNVAVFEDEFIELFNPSDLPISLGSLAISDEPVNYPQKHSLAQLSFIAPRGFVLLTPTGNSADPSAANELPFRLSSANEWISLRGTNGVVIDQVHLVNQRGDFSRGRSPDGESTYQEYLVPTPGSTNNSPRETETLLIQNLRISEIMSDPLDGSEFEFIELQNIGSQPLNLSGVRFSEGIRFTFPDLILPAGEFLLLVQDRAAFESRYGGGLPIAGEYHGKLDNGGERLRLEIPKINAGIHDFEYDDWFPAAAGYGFSLDVNDTSQPVASWNEKQSWSSSLAINGTPGNAGLFSIRTQTQTTLTLPNQLTLTPFVSFGSISPASVTFQWQSIDGPAPVFFSKPGSPDTEASFTQGGLYTLRLAASAFDFHQTQEIVVTVYDSYSTWILRPFGSEIPGITGKNDDADSDGISNLFEFALGRDPIVPDSLNFPLPLYDPAGDALAVTWTQDRLDPTKFAVVPEVSTDLKTWFSGPSYLDQQVISKNNSSITYSATALANSGETKIHFMRLRVISNEDGTIPVAPQIIGIKNVHVQPAITFVSQFGQSYQLEFTDDPRNSWIPIGDSVIATSTETTLIDDTQQSPSFRLYRIRLRPAN